MYLGADNIQSTFKLYENFEDAQLGRSCVSPKDSYYITILAF